MIVKKKVDLLVQFGEFLNIEIYRRGFYALSCRVYYGSEGDKTRRDAIPISILNQEKDRPELGPGIRNFETCKRNHTCNWKCRDRQYLFASQVIRIDTRGDTIPLLSAAHFELEFPALDKQTSEHFIFLDVDLYFLDAEAGTPVSSHDHLNFQQSRRFKFKPHFNKSEANTRPIMHSHFLAQFDGIFVSSCDVFVSAAFTGCVFKTDEFEKIEKSMSRPATPVTALNLLGWATFGVVDGVGAVLGVVPSEEPAPATPDSLSALLYSCIRSLTSFQDCIKEFLEEEDGILRECAGVASEEREEGPSHFTISDAALHAMVSGGLNGQSPKEDRAAPSETDKDLTASVKIIVDSFISKNSETEVILGLIRVIELISSKLQCVWMMFASGAGILSEQSVRYRRMLETSLKFCLDSEYILKRSIKSDQEYQLALTSIGASQVSRSNKVLQWRDDDHVKLVTVSKYAFDEFARESVVFQSGGDVELSNLTQLLSKSRSKFFDSFRRQESTGSLHSVTSLLADFPVPANYYKHLIVFVHGLLGSSFDMKMYNNQLIHSLRCLGLDENDQVYLVSEVNEEDTFQDIEVMADRLVSEIRAFIREKHLNVERISFVCHSLGGLICRCAIQSPAMDSFRVKFDTFVSLSSPHCSLYFHSNALMTSALRMYQLIGRSKSLDQLNLKDDPDPRKCLLYRLSQNEHIGLGKFRAVRLFGSLQDGYVPVESALVDASLKGGEAPMQDVFMEMAAKINECNESIEKYQVQFGSAYPSSASADALIGRKAHIAMLTDSAFLNLVTSAFL
ncbi:putative serine esterase-domain-containing protein [Chytriomyces cf. hyalinus JEL632]|nr:putative serine esterase-domain-containing protein [Chytriomyces cf. hyalinus JEL632]